MESKGNRHWVDKSSKRLAVVGSFIMLALIFLFVINIVLRYLFESPLSGVYEIVQVVMVLIICFGFAYAESEGSHIKITMFTEKMHPRVQRFLQFLTRLLSFFMLCLLTWAGVQFAIDNHATNGSTPLIGIPIYPFALLFGIGWLLMAVVMLVKIISNSQEKEHKSEF